MSGLPFAARSTPKTPVDHKIHLQIQFSQKFPPRFIFHRQNTDFTGKYLCKNDSYNLPGMVALNSPSPTFHYQNDHGILQETGNTGKGGSKSSQGKIQRFGKQAPAHGTAEDIPGTRYLIGNGECHEDWQEIPADKRPLPHLFALHFFW
jgi:hypothetical protein